MHYTGGFVNPLAMFFTMMTVYALCNVVYACVMLYLGRRKPPSQDGSYPLESENRGYTSQEPSE